MILSLIFLHVLIAIIALHQYTSIKSQIEINRQQIKVNKNLTTAIENHFKKHERWLD